MGFKKYFPWKTREQAINYEIKPLGITCDQLRKNPDGMIVTIPPIRCLNIPNPQKARSLGRTWQKGIPSFSSPAPSWKRIHIP